MDYPSAINRERPQAGEAVLDGGSAAGHPTNSERIEELGRIIMVYSEVMEKLQLSQERLERKVQSLRTELGEKNRLLERRNRLAALGEMAAGMAHEIRNPLGGIRLYASMLARDVHDRPESVTLVQKMVKGVKRLEELVSSVLQFTREMRISPARVNLRQIIAEALDLAASSMLNADVQAEVRGPVDLVVMMDPLLMGQAMLNLVLNATEAMSGGGTVSVAYNAVMDRQEMNGQEIGSDEIGTESPVSGVVAHESQQAILPAGMLELVVQDNGPGIPGEILDKIFNPFFTTRDTGTGLGLAIVHRIVESHNGTITVSNPPEGGAKFLIRMPMTQTGPMV